MLLKSHAFLCVFSPFFCGSTSKKVRWTFSVFVFLKMDFFHSYLTKTLAGYKILGWKSLLLKSPHHCLQKSNVAVLNLVSFLFWRHSLKVIFSTTTNSPLLAWGTFRISSLTRMSFVMICLTVSLFYSLCWLFAEWALFMWTLTFFSSLTLKEERKDSIRKIFKKQTRNRLIIWFSSALRKKKYY